MKIGTQYIAKRNTYMIKLAKTYAVKMLKNLSPLEDRMANYFNIRGIEYESQKPFFIRDKNEMIIKFFIADFYIPSAKLIVETDGKFHQEEREYDNLRDNLITEQYKDVSIIRFTWHDLDNQDALNELFQRVLFASNKSKNYTSKQKVFQGTPDKYFMFFFSDQSKLFELTGSELKLLLYCWVHASNYGEGNLAGNIIYNNKFFKEKCHKEGLSIANAVIDNTFSKLHRKGFLLKMAKCMYLINPLYAFKGTLTQREELIKTLIDKGKIDTVDRRLLA